MQLQMVLVVMEWVAIPQADAVKKYARCQNAPKIFMFFDLKLNFFGRLTSNDQFNSNLNAFLEIWK